MSAGENRWLHVPSGIVCTYVGEDRGASNEPFALMEMPDGTRARIDPLELVRKDGNWRKL